MIQLIESTCGFSYNPWTKKTLECTAKLKIKGDNSEYCADMQ